jgi:hypothetical protein
MHQAFIGRVFSIAHTNEEHNSNAQCNGIVHDTKRDATKVVASKKWSPPEHSELVR